MDRLFGARAPVEIHAQRILVHLAGVKDARLLSLGCGNAHKELKLTQRLLELGMDDFTLECVELSEQLCAQNTEKAEELGIADHIRFTSGDLNKWQAPGAVYHFVIATQILHHVVELEHLFAQVQASLLPEGVFFVRDMIGMNGHQIWPEAKRIVDEIWSALPEPYRFDHKFEKVCAQVPNIDWSAGSFEGIRAQDIMPLLVENFGFSRFVAFGGLIDHLIERAFGPNYDMDNPDDRFKSICTGF